MSFRLSIFPEIKYFENFDEKEIFLNKCMPKSVFCITVSEKLKEKVENYYPFLKDKCVVLPLNISHLDQNLMEIKNNNGNDYIFYQHIIVLTRITLQY